MAGGSPTSDEEEGELPAVDLPVQDDQGGDQESGEASGFDEGEVQETGEEEKPPHLQAPPPAPAAAGSGGPRRHSSRSNRRAAPAAENSHGDRGGSRAAGSQPPAAPGRGEQSRGPGASDNTIPPEQREREELLSLLRELTRYVSVQDAMRSLDTVCQDLKKAIKKLDKLLRVCKKKKGEDVEAYPECFGFSKKIVEGLKSVHVVVGTSIGHTQKMESVLMLFKAAMNYRHDVFTLPHKQELEGWVRGSKVLKVILEEKERAKAEGARATEVAAAAAAATAEGTPVPEQALAAKATPAAAEGAAGRQAAAGMGMGSPKDGGARSGSVGQNRRPTPLAGEWAGTPVVVAEAAEGGGEAGGSGIQGGVRDGGELLPPPPAVAIPAPQQQAGGPALPNGQGSPGSPSQAPIPPPPPPPPSSPPPPPESYPEYHSPMSEDPVPPTNQLTPTPAQQPDQPSRLAGPRLSSGGRGGVKPAAHHPGSSAFKFKIVVESSASDIRKANLERAAAELASGSQQPAAAAPAVGAGEAGPDDSGQEAANKVAAVAAGVTAGEAAAAMASPKVLDVVAAVPEVPAAVAAAEAPHGRRERRRGAKEHSSARARPSEEEEEEGKGEQVGGVQGGGIQAGERSSKERERERERERGGRTRGRDRESEMDEGQQGTTVAGSHSKRPHRSSKSPDGSSRASKRARADAQGSTRDRSSRHRHDRGDRGFGGSVRGSSGERLGAVHGSRGRSRDRGDPLDPGFSRGRSRDRGGPFDLGFSRGRSRDQGFGGLFDLGFSRGRSRDGRDGLLGDLRGPGMISRGISRDRSRSREGGRGRSRRLSSRSTSRDRGRARSWERERAAAAAAPPSAAAPPAASLLPSLLLGLEDGVGPTGAPAAAAAAAPPAAGPAFIPPESPVSEEEADGRASSLGPPPLPLPSLGVGSQPLAWTYEQREKDRQARERAAAEASLAAATAEASAAGLAAEQEDVPAGPSAEASALLQQGRMVLALDLDHTLLNSARMLELDSETTAQLTQRLAAEAKSLQDDQQRELYRSERLGIWTKLRPGARDFLARAAEKFELWVYSAGSRPYAEAMASLLDPEDRFFRGRVVAAGGAADGPQGMTAELNARLLAALEQRGPVVLALDDADAQWPLEARLALFVVERYLFFPANSRRYGMEGRSLLEINRDECPDRGMLMTTWHLLERLHSLVMLYANHPGPAGQLLSAPPVEPNLPPWDIRNVLADERRKVLAGVCLSFSRVIPVGIEPWLHPLWKLAEAYGARCSARCEDSITHVVASARGTEKTCWAARHGRPVVTPAWLECCGTLWRKANEERFATPL